MWVILIVAAYFLLLMAVARLTAGKADNHTFFRGERRSPWWAVAFGMLGASMSGVTFVSVPGMVVGAQMTYLQMCLGFLPGYLLVAFVLLPLYYRMNLTSIYTYLAHRFDTTSYTTGAAFFLLSKMAGASVRLYLVCLILQTVVFAQWHVPFALSATLLLVLIWCYTQRGGIRTIVWTDCVQTLVMLAALVLIIRAVLAAQGWGMAEAVHAIGQSPLSRVAEWDMASPRYFWKQFLSGIFIVIVMTGLDQDMMQKNLTCRTLRQAQLNMVVNGTLYLPANLLFLCLGVLLVLFAGQHGISLPARSDEMLPFLCSGGYLGQTALVCFTVGIVAAAFSSADSAYTALTTSMCVDILKRPDDQRLRRRVHVGIMLLSLLFIILFDVLNQTSVIDAVYQIASYTYGPLLGLFAFGMFTNRQPRRALVPYICLAAPLTCWLLSVVTARVWEYHFGYELLMLNGLLVFVGLWLSAAGKKKVS